ncbi:MAG: phosphoenolpyruvate--protein phosphotransferase [Desulfohalobiaceae bacterium]|nr:phosphoenolpyruvate--protein phosphotransferase [Desulfohalobiaceae bacterium]
MARTILTGEAVSSGVSVGKAYLLAKGHYCLTSVQNIPEDHVEQEAERLQNAFNSALQSLERIKSSVPQEQQEHAAILDSHIMILRDPKLRRKTERYIRELLMSAEWALEKGVADVEKGFSRVDDEYFQARANEIRLLTHRVMNHLSGSASSIKPITSRVILVAHDLTPADTVELNVSKIMALATAQGGKTSHVSIMARSLEIPAVVGVENVDTTVRDSDFVIVDGFQGKVVVDPSDEELEHYTNLKYQFENYRREIMRHRELPGESRDGFRINVMANIELFEEVRAVLDYGGEGVGLYRTEYSYLYRHKLPSEEELTEEYSDLASILHPKEVVIRTLDAGGDKIGKGFENLEEANPALGLRAVRFCLKHRDIFKSQLRAILRATQHGNIAMMFPMISGLNELREAKEVLEEAKHELRLEGIGFDEDMPTGIMIELPSAVMVSDLLAREVDFFSIGTNDLIQYSLGIDRTNRHVAHLYQPLHPALIRSIKHVVDAGHREGIEVSMCGEMAVDPYCLPVLLGMQVDNLSLNPQSIPVIKKVMRQLSTEECFDLLKRILESDSVSQSNRLVKENVFNRFPEELLFYSSMLEKAT